MPTIELIAQIKQLQKENKELIQANYFLSLTIARIIKIEKFTCVMCKKEIEKEDKGILNITTFCSDDCQKEAIKKQKRGE